MLRLQTFREKLNEVINNGQFGDGTVCGFNELFAAINNLMPSGQKFTVLETDSALQKMSDANQVMYSDDKIYTI